MARGRLGLNWSFKEKDGWAVTSAPALGANQRDLQLPCEFKIDTCGAPPRPYLSGRCKATLDKEISGLELRFACNLSGATSTTVTLVLATDSKFDNRVLTRKLDASGDCVCFDFIDTSSLGEGEFFCMLNFYFPEQAGAAIKVDAASLRCRALTEKSLGSVHFNSIGDETKASSRLRVFKIARALEERGVGISYNCTPSEDVEVLVNQKVRPQALARKFAAKPTRIVYDFDDHIAMDGRGVLDDLTTFIDSADLVTVGTEFLAQFARRFHPNVKVLENPADIMDDTVCREPRGKIEKICWFGSPESLRQLEAIEVGEPVTTITAGGDIEFNVATVDRDITGFDLCLFPLEPTEWNLAKNSNRLIKAVALGMPVLAGDTPEHRRVAEQLGLSEDYLVPRGGDWIAAIARLRANPAAVEATIKRARRAALDLYSPEVIAEEWAGWVADAPRRALRGGGRQPATRPAHPTQASTAVLVINPGSVDTLLNGLRRSEISWSGFGRNIIIRPGGRDNVVFEFSQFEHMFVSDPTLVFTKADEILATLDTDYVLLLPPGYALKYGAVEIFDYARDNPGADVIAFGSNSMGSARDALPDGDAALLAFMTAPMSAGPLLVKREWMARKLKFASVLGYYSWYYTIAAATSDRSFARLPHPGALRLVERKAENLSQIYLEWLRRHHPALAADFPDAQKQWERITTDVITRCIGETGRWSLIAAAMAITELSKRGKND